MKFYESSTNYDYSLPAVTLAYFLRYPNPYSKHVLSTDVIERYIDPVTHRLHTTRLHRKKSKVPSAILKLLPPGLAGPGGSSQALVLEKSIIDIKEGWMEHESCNLDWSDILNVVERQTYRRTPLLNQNDDASGASDAREKEGTSCKTVVTFVSRLGQNIFTRGSKKPEGSEQESKPNFLTAWTYTGLQRTIELVGVKRAQSALANGKDGMKVVLERLRNGGLMGVLEGMHRDHMDMMAADGGHWKQVWDHGNRGTES